MKKFVTFYGCLFFSLCLLIGSVEVAARVPFKPTHQLANNRLIKDQPDMPKSQLNVNTEWANATGLMTIYSDDESMTSIEFAIPDKNGDYYPFGRQENLILPVVPANPTVVGWYDCGDESGGSRFFFNLPTTDVNGYLIDPKYLSVSFYVNNNNNGTEIFTFSASTYVNDLTTDATMIPYSIFRDGNDFHSTYFSFYRTNAKGYTPLFTHGIGIQVHYTIYETLFSSDIVWANNTWQLIDPPTASIQSGSIVPPDTKVYLSAHSEFGDSYIYYAVEPMSANDFEWKDYQHQQGITIEKDMRIYAYQKDNAAYGGNQSEIVVFTYHVTDSILTGDANGDGEVNIADINAIIDAILNDEMEDRFDVNRDGELNIADINAVIDIILNN